MEFAFEYGMWGLLRHEKSLAAVCTGYTCLFKAKDILKLSCINNLFQNFLVLKTCASHI